MKFGILTQYYPPEMGAPQARLSELAQHFVERGHEVHVLTAMPNYPRGKVYDGYGGLYRHEMLDGVHVQRTFIYPTKSVGLVKRLANYFSFVGSSALVGAMKLPKLDYLMVESPPLFLGMAAYFLTHLKRTRMIFNVSDLWPESAVHLGVLGEGRSLDAAWALEKFCYDKAWLVTGQSREILQSITDRFPQIPTYHLSNGVDTLRFGPDFAVESTRAALKQDAECVAIYGGLHGIAQGLDQVLDALAKIPEMHEQLRVVFVGDGAEKEALIAHSQSLGLQNVGFMEPQPRERMPELLASADIALVPLKNYLPGAVPSKVYEGMAANLPVVLVAQGEATRIVGQADAGYVVAPGDIDGLAEALKSLCLNSAERQRLGSNGRQTTIEKYDRKAIANAFIDHLEKTC